MRGISFVIFTFCVLFSSCTSNVETFTKEEITSYSNDLGFSQNNLYFIKPEFQQEMLEIGQPNTVIFNKNMQKLQIGTCYEEYPFFMDEFFNVKAQLTDTLEMYDFKNKIDLKEVFSQIQPNANSPMQLDSTKKYYHFYYYANYAKDMDAKLKPAISKYKDSVQFFFINIDKVK